MSKKVLILSLTVFVVLSGLFAFAFFRYTAVDFYCFYEKEGDYTFNGKFFISADGEEALFYQPISRNYDVCEKLSFDLSECGFAGESISGYFHNGIFYGADEEYEGFWPVSTQNKFVYIREGAKFAVDLLQKKSYPLFAGSIEGVSPEAENVKGFSSDGVFALGIEGTDAVIYVSDTDASSFKIASVHRLSLAEFGEKIEFGAFLGKKAAYVVAKRGEEEKLIAIDCSQRIAKEGLLPEGEYGAVLSRLYIEKKDVPADENKRILAWNNRLLGDAFSVSLDRAKYPAASLCTVSQDGKYAVIRAQNAAGEEEILVAHEGKLRSLSAFVEFRDIVRIEFPYENILFFVTRDAAGAQKAMSCKICF